MQAHRQEFRLCAMCGVLRVNRAGYYAWLQSPISERVKEDERLLGLIKHQWRRSDFKLRHYPEWWPGTESNRRHEDFQSSALPTELPGHDDASCVASRILDVRSGVRVKHGRWMNAMRTCDALLCRTSWPGLP